ncbi:hypothetical protein Q5X58_17530 [Acinetobacter baumannii]|uniref:DUF6670 family protein n=1 Tax=Acinetobacter calcoaceticus/baumannii complex TaxID=909768 RepID=UPI00244C8789|nr:MULTISPECIES: DUF6670 family protein [Acinetobacter calcoaceticus/baumannii complex]MDH2544578.1 hypothetical protein [Acinetobacter baumannii]MDH2566659.1 hypothetical protein [Acinetobacter baumannii]MDO7218892.1 hypothetical protein [Acinetobacter nosocomialis]MDO7474005.1 hypothetical protein [Acinetobacter baumannii]MDV7659613.1 DUF6670 family protein [Acinetobacter baumannii]
MEVKSNLIPSRISEKLHKKIAKVSGSLFGAVKPERQDKLPREYELSPHVDYKRYGSTHYGVMIPDLPEPYRYLSWASVIGYVGFTITDMDYQMSSRGKGDTASLVHGTALSTTQEAYKTYSIKDNIKFSKNPFAVNFDDQSVLYEDAEGYLLITNREDLQVEIRLRPTKAISWFAHGAIYKHFSLLMQYEGVLSQKGETIKIQGLCTLESWKAVATSMLKNKWLVDNVQLPVKIFTYQVINIDSEQQLLLAMICYESQPVLTSVYYRHVNGTSIQYNGETTFEVIKFKNNKEITPDGYRMQVPDQFKWVAYHNNKKILEINASVDTPYCFGLAAGYVTSYAWNGEFNSMEIEGRGYMEYIDRR